jgi:hypothetical protein
MAKVILPLLSSSASGQIAKAMVHFPWNGLNVVRRWGIPANPKSATQGDQRMILGGMAKAFGAVNKLEAYYAELVARNVVVAPQTWISYLVDRAITNYALDATAFEALVTEFEAHTENATFDTEALDRGLVNFTIPYKGTAEIFEAGLQLYISAKVAINIGFTTAPYTTALASWSAANVDTHADNLFGAD